MPFEVHQEKTYPHERSVVYQAALQSVQKLKGQMLKSSPQEFQLEAKFDKTLLGKVLGERTNLTCSIQPEEEGSRLIVDAYPLDAVGRKLMFGARKGVTQQVVNLFIEHLENSFP